MNRGDAPAGAALGAAPVELPPLDSVVPIAKQQLYERLSRSIIDQILGGTLAPGQRLPPERELARAYGVSRPSLREALGALQMLGIVETRHGSGSWITERALDALADHPNGVLDMGDSPVMLLEARAAIEPTIAALAAERYTHDTELEGLLDEMNAARNWEDPIHRATWSDADRHYHQRLAVHTQNTVLIATADFIASIQAQTLWRRLRDDTLTVPERIPRAIEEHERIFAAVSAYKPAEAADAARDHLDAVRESMGLE